MQAAALPPDPARAWRALVGHIEVVLDASLRKCLRATSATAIVGGHLIVESHFYWALDAVQQRLADRIAEAMPRFFGECIPVDYRLARVPDVTSALDLPEARPAGPGSLIGHLDAGMTFASYVRGSGNAVALQGARDILDCLPGAPRPMVVWGPNGAGKTHLLQAMAHDARARGWTVACLTAEAFLDSYVSGNGDGRSVASHRGMRAVRLFVLDELQYLAARKAARTIEDLSISLDAILRGGGFVAIASERHPKELPLPPALVDRLNEGLVTQIGPFDRGERVVLVTSLLERSSSAIPQWTIERIAAADAMSVRAIRGAVTFAIAANRSGQLTPGTLDDALARLVIGSVTSTGFDQIIARVANHFAMEKADLAGPSQRRTVADARAVAVALGKAAGIQQTEMARRLGRGRSGIGEIAKRGEALIHADPSLRRLSC